MIKPPLSNLGPMSEPWARHITDQTQQNAKAIESLGGDASNDGRNNNSSLDLMATQITELNQRQALYFSSSNLSTGSFNESSGTQTVSTNIQITPPTGSTRRGWLSFSAVPTMSGAGALYAFLSLSVDGRVFYRSSVALPVSAATPSGWDGFTFFGATGFTASSTSGGVIGVTFQAIPDVFGPAGSRTASLTNIQISAAYGQKVN